MAEYEPEFNELTRETVNHMDSSSLGDLVVGETYFIVSILFRYWSKCKRGQYFLKIGDIYYKANTQVARFCANFIPQKPYDLMEIRLPDGLEFSVRSKIGWKGRNVVSLKFKSNEKDMAALKNVPFSPLSLFSKRFSKYLIF